MATLCVRHTQTHYVSGTDSPPVRDEEMGLRFCLCRTVPSLQTGRGTPRPRFVALRPCPETPATTQGPVVWARAKRGPHGPEPLRASASSNQRPVSSSPMAARVAGLFPRHHTGHRHPAAPDVTISSLAIWSHDPAWKSFPGDTSPLKSSVTTVIWTQANAHYDKT